MSDQAFDPQAIEDAAVEAAGVAFVKPDLYWVGDEDGLISALDDTGLPNTIWVHKDPQTRVSTIAYTDPTKNTKQYRNDLPVDVIPCYDVVRGKRISWQVIGANVKLASVRPLSDPSIGTGGNVIAHTHQTVDEGAQLDAGQVFNGGRVSAQYGGTNNDLIGNPPDDGTMFIWVAANSRLEPVSFPFGGLLEGRDGGTPVPLTPAEPNDTLRSYFDVVDRWKRVRNNLTATTNPTPSDDESDGYDVASLWFNLSTGVLYWCKDNATGAAVWVIQTLGTPKIGIDTIDPTVTDDSDSGYGVGSLWINSATPALFICYDATVGAADWQSAGGSSGLLYNMTSAVNPTGSDDDTLGYSAGSIWYNGVDLTLWFCFSANTGTAEWHIIYAYSSVPTLAINTATGATYTLDVTNYFLKVDATSNNVTVTLPPAASVFGRQYIVKRIDSSGNTVTLDGDASETIDGATTKLLATQYQSVTVISDGTEWWLL